MTVISPQVIQFLKSDYNDKSSCNSQINKLDKPINPMIIGIARKSPALRNRIGNTKSMAIKNGVSCSLCCPKSVAAIQPKAKTIKYINHINQKKKLLQAVFHSYTEVHDQISVPISSIGREIWFTVNR